MPFGEMTFRVLAFSGKAIDQVLGNRLNVDSVVHKIKSSGSKGAIFL